MRVFIAAAAILVAAAGPAAAANHQKECILIATGNLPASIAGRIDRSSAKTLDDSEALDRAVAAFLKGDMPPEKAFYTEASAKEFAELVRQYDRERPTAMITAALKRQNIEATAVSLSGHVAGVAAVFKAVCFFNYGSLWGVVGPVLDD